MVNSIYSYGGYYGGMNSLMGGQSSNVPRYYLETYGNGYEDFGTKPYSQPYPFAYIERKPEPIMEKSAFLRFIKKCFFM